MTDTYNAMTDRRTRYATITDPVTGKTRAEQVDILPIKEKIQPMEALPSKPAPVIVTPIAPPAPPETHFDESPTQLRIELEKRALKAIQVQLQRIDTLEQSLDVLDDTVEHRNDAIQRVWNGQFHTDSTGQRLIKFLDVMGTNHLTHLMQSGQFDPSVNGGFIQRHQRLLGGSTTRIFMVHESIKSLDELYDHPENVAVVQQLAERKRERILSQVAQARLDLSEYKTSVKAQLKELDKRFKSILD
ncbi:Uncharacterised protein [Klebsiella pneumoniae]|nr:hypothetical protein [Enterobacter hormaechei]SSW79423.1 Uncharacterised protein [Klebsiella pneumoniae]